MMHLSELAADPRLLRYLNFCRGLLAFLFLFFGLSYILFDIGTPITGLIFGVALGHQACLLLGSYYQAVLMNSQMQHVVGLGFALEIIEVLIAVDGSVLFSVLRSLCYLHFLQVNNNLTQYLLNHKFLFEMVFAQERAELQQILAENGLHKRRKKKKQNKNKTEMSFEEELRSFAPNKRYFDGETNLEEPD